MQDSAKFIQERDMSLIRNILSRARDSLKLKVDDVLSALSEEELVSLLFLILDKHQLILHGYEYSCYALSRNYREVGLGIQQCLNFYENSKCLDVIIEALYYIGHIDILEDVFGMCAKHNVHQICKHISQIDPKKLILYKIFSSLTATNTDKLIHMQLSHWYCPAKSELFEVTFCRNLGSSNFDNLVSDIYIALQKEEHDELAAMLYPYITTGILTLDTKLIDDSVYPMSREYPYGLCVIINVKDFIKPKIGELERPVLTTRHGSEIDVQRLTGTFKLFGFQVKILNNPSYNKIEVFFKYLRANAGLSNYSCLAICMMTHGDENDNIYLHDRLCISVTSLRRLCFNPFFVDKPRLYFVQACRGEETLKPIFLQRDFTATTTTNIESDCLICAATVRGHSAIRSKSSGSWFITDLCTSLQEYGHQTTLKRVLQHTRRKLKSRVEKDGTVFTQISEDMDTLLKDVLFRRADDQHFLDGILDLAALELEEDLIESFLFEILEFEINDNSPLFGMLASLFLAADSEY